MKVFLTGGTGFVGSFVAEQLQSAGHEVVALVRKSSDIEYLSSLGVEMVEGQLGKAAQLDDVLCSVDAVVHVAGLTASFSPDWLYRINVEGTRDLVDRSAEVCPEGTRFIYISSVAAQGPSKDSTPRPADKSPAPVSHYGRSKLDGEGAVLAHRDRLRTTILRPPAVYGPKDEDMFQVFALANRRLSPVLGAGNRCLSIIHVDDAASAIVACLDAPGDGEVYTVDDGGCYTWRELGSLISEAVGKKSLTVPLPKWIFAGAAMASELGGRVIKKAPAFDRDKYREMVQSSWVCGHEAIQRDLGWKPKWDLAGGAKQTATWYRENGWL